MPHSKSIDSLISGALWRVPPLPGALAILLNSTADTGVDIEEVADVVSVDEVLTCRVMRAANSAALGFRSPARTVQQAVGRLGCAHVRSMALTKALAQLVVLPAEVGGVPRVRLWEHNWATAAAAAHLARFYGLEREEARLAGLLHDTGKLVLASCVPDEYRQCVEQANGRGTELTRAEIMTLGRSHGSVGADALRSWGLPNFVLQAAQEHHEAPGSAPISLAGRLVRIANAIAHAAGAGKSGDPRPLTPWVCAAADEQIKEPHVKRCLEKLAMERPGLEEMAAQFARDPAAAGQ